MSKIEYAYSQSEIPKAFDVPYAFETQEEFYTKVKEAKLPQDVSFARFKAHFTDSGADPNTQILGFLHHKKEAYADKKVNMINYVATTAEGKLKEEPQKGLLESLDNFSSVVVEQPLAEVSKRDVREYEWQTKVLPDGREQMSLVSQFGDMDTILEEALRSSQVADFEHDRYKANLNNYKKIQSARERGDHTPFVEFSPSPDLTPQAKARGYFGMDAIFFYRYDKETGKEVIEQRWLKAPKEAYWKLVGDLSQENYAYLSDAGIMNKSQFLTESQEEVINQFIDDNNGKFKDQAELEIYRYEQLEPKIKKMAEPILEIAAQKMILGMPIDDELKQLEATGAYLQHLLREKVKNLLGVDKTRTNLTDELKTRLENDSAYLAQFVAQNRAKMPLAGCGGSNDAESNGMSTGMMDAGKDKYGSLTFRCPACGENHTRSPGKLMVTCPVTHKDIPKC
jgi:hypothetical protein